MSECKRNGCTQPAEARPRYEGFCSLQCRDMHEDEMEISKLKATIAWYQDEGNDKDEEVERLKKILRARAASGVATAEIAI